MNNGNTAVTYDVVERESNNIQECGKTMENVFNSFMDAMNQIGATEAFVGRAGDALNENFNRLKRSFDDYISLVNQFALSFKGAAQTTSEMDKKLENQASNL